MKHLVVVPAFFVALWACGSLAVEPAKQADAFATRLIQAKEDFLQACRRLDEEVLVAIDAEIEIATNDGDFDKAKKATAVKEAFLKDGLLPSAGGLYRATMQYNSQFVESRQEAEAVFDEVIAECTKNSDLTRADSIQAEKKRWLDLVKSLKTPKTRYWHPVVGAVRWEKNGHYYKVLDTGRTPVGISFSVAKKQCEEVGGYLACGDSPGEIDFLKSLAGRAWTGAYKDKQGKWVWINGVALANAPVGDGKDFGFARTVPQGLQAIPQDGTRQVRTWAYICEWDE